MPPFASPEVYEFLEAEGFLYAIRLPANRVLQQSIAHLLRRPVGRPPKEVRRYHASFSYKAQSWSKSRRVVAKVEWHPGERFPRVGFIVTNLSRPAERVIAFYNQRGTAEQYIKEGKNAINWTRLSCHGFRNNEVASSAARLGIQLGQLPAHARLARRSGPLVADHLTREADQDWSEGRAPQPLHHFPDGGSGGLERPVPKNPEAD